MKPDFSVMRWVEPVTKLVRELFRAETSAPGRINVLGMVLGAIVACALALPPIFEAIVKVFRPEVTLGVPLLQIFISFLLFVLLCAGGTAYLERGSSAGR